MPMPGRSLSSSEGASSGPSRQIRPYRHPLPPLDILTEAYPQPIHPSSVFTSINDQRVQEHPRLHPIQPTSQPIASIASLYDSFQAAPIPSPASASTSRLSGYQTDYPRATAPRRPYRQAQRRGTAIPPGNVKAPPAEAYLILRPHRRPREGWEGGGLGRGGIGPW